MRFLTYFLISILIAGFGSCHKVHAQNLPSGDIAAVSYTNPGTTDLYTFSFTANTTGASYIGFAFRQDPGWWTFSNASVTSTGSSTNLLANGNLQYGGSTTAGVTAPADWGVWYQNGTVPQAAGTWSTGQWYDGAVGSFDGIYQSINTTAGSSYTIKFNLEGTNASSNPSIEVGVYSGACAAGTTIFTCTPAASAGFTAEVTPQQTQGVGGAPAPSGPTVVSTQNTTIQTTTTSGSTVSTYNQPVILTTYSDGTTSTANNGTATLISTTTTGTSGGITTTQQSQVNSVVMPGHTLNSIYINQSGNSDTIKITQTGAGNKLDGATASSAVITGGNNNITVRQVSGNNLLDLTALGGTNTLNLNQGSDSNGNAGAADQGGHYQYDYINGTGNNVTIVQENTGLNEGMFSSLLVNGNLNTVGITQSGSAKMQLFASITGNSNTLTTSQTGTSPHYLSVTETGNSNSAVVTQNNSNASGANSATVVLNNSGSPASVNITQTGGQTYSITQTCYTTCGTVTVHQ